MANNNQTTENSLTSIAQECNLITGLSAGLREMLKTCVLDLSDKIQQDNFGTRSYKDGDLLTLIGKVSAVNQSAELADTIRGVFN